MVNKPLGILNDQFWALFKASIESNGLLDNRGPPGCGKSEAFVDAMWLCGISTAVINCSDTSGFCGGDYQPVFQYGTIDPVILLQGVDCRHTIVLDEVNQLS